MQKIQAQAAAAEKLKPKVTYDFGDDDEDDYTSADLTAGLAEQGLMNIIPGPLSVVEQTNLYDADDYKKMEADTDVSGFEFGFNPGSGTLGSNEVTTGLEGLDGDSLANKGVTNLFDISPSTDDGSGSDYNDTGVVYDRAGNAHATQADADASNKQIDNALAFSNFSDAEKQFGVGYGEGQVDPSLLGRLQMILIMLIILAVARLRLILLFQMALAHLLTLVLLQWIWFLNTIKRVMLY